MGNSRITVISDELQSSRKKSFACLGGKCGEINTFAACLWGCLVVIRADGQRFGQVGIAASGLLTVLQNCKRNYPRGMKTALSGSVREDWRAKNRWCTSPFFLVPRCTSSCKELWVATSGRSYLKADAWVPGETESRFRGGGGLVRTNPTKAWWLLTRKESLQTCFLSPFYYNQLLETAYCNKEEGFCMKICGEFLPCISELQSSSAEK